jgi:tryptophanyl-tRNA synthetase
LGQPDGSNLLTKMSKSNKLTTCQELSKDESERRKKYREFINGMLREKDAMKGEMNRRVVYGMTIS